MATRGRRRLVLLAVTVTCGLALARAAPSPAAVTLRVAGVNATEAALPAGAAAVLGAAGVVVEVSCAPQQDLVQVVGTPDTARLHGAFAAGGAAKGALGDWESLPGGAARPLECAAHVAGLPPALTRATTVVHASDFAAGAARPTRFAFRDAADAVLFVADIECAGCEAFFQALEAVHLPPEVFELTGTGPGGVAQWAREGAPPAPEPADASAARLLAAREEALSGLERAFSTALEVNDTAHVVRAVYALADALRDELDVKAAPGVSDAPPSPPAATVSSPSKEPFKLAAVLLAVLAGVEALLLGVAASRVRSRASSSTSPRAAGVPLAPRPLKRKDSGAPPPALSTP